MLFNPSRDEARLFLFESWRKRRAGELLTPLEDLAAQLIAKHPEYFAVLEDPERHQEQDYQPEQGATNPFLHLMMHLTIEEQISIDQPAGIRAHFVRLTQKLESDTNSQLHAQLNQRLTPYEGVLHRRITAHAHQFFWLRRPLYPLSYSRIC